MEALPSIKFAKGLLPIIFLVSVIFKIAQAARTAIWSDLRKVPGPWYASWTNLVLKFHVLKGERSQYIHALHGKYGEFVRIAPTEVAIANLDAFKTIHRVGTPFLKSDWYAKLNQSEHPGVFVMADPKQHANRRRLLAQPFSKSVLKTWEGLITQRVQTTIAKIKRDAESGTADILKWFTFMATDIIGELSFGKSFDMLQSGEKNKYIRDLEATLMISGIRVELDPLITIASYLPIPALRNAISLNVRLNEYGHRAIQNHKQAVVSKTSGNGSTTIFSKMLDSTKNQGLSDAEIEQEASNLIVAGSDTTGVSLTYLIWAILHPSNERVRERLEAEVKTLPANPGATELAALPYLSATVKETLRLHGAAPGSLPRMVPGSGSSMGEYYLPGGTTVVTQAYTMHRDPKIFSEPLEYKPERWLKPSKEMEDAFSPFGAGSRVCLGLHLAMLELLLGAYTFLTECPGARIAPSTTDEDMEFENYFLIAPKSHKCEVTLC